MNKSEVLKIAERISLVNSLYGTSLAPEAVLFHANSLADLDFESVIQAFDTFVKTNKTNRPPTPAHIREIITPEIDERNVAIELAHKIDRAVSRYGYTWEEGYFSDEGNYWLANGKKFNSFRDAVIEELGIAGWNFICSRGGWQNVRNSANLMGEGMFIAQSRDHIESLLKSSDDDFQLTALSYPRQRKVDYRGSDTLPIYLMPDDQDENY